MVAGQERRSSEFRAGAPASLADALGVTRQSAVAFVGAGGKTSALAAVCRSVSPCYAAATSHIGDWQVGFAHAHVVWPEADGCTPPDVPEGAVVLFTGEPDDPPSRLRGISLAQAAALCARAWEVRRPVLFEADGSRRRPLKAPADHEPPVPAGVDIVVVVAGLLGLGHPLDERRVHRPERFAALAGCAPGTTLTPEIVARALTHPLGGFRNTPRGARRIVLLNQADTPALRAVGEDLADRILPYVDGVVVAALALGGETGAGAALDVFEKHRQ